MILKQFENIYKANNLNNFVLRTEADVLKTHGIAFNEIDAFTELKEDEKAAAVRYVIRLMNQFDLEERYSFYVAKIEKNKYEERIEIKYSTCKAIGSYTLAFNKEYGWH